MSESFANKICYAVCRECYLAEITRLSAESVQKQNSVTAINVVFTIIAVIVFTFGLLAFIVNKH